MPNNYIDDNYISQRLRGKQRLRKDYNEVKFVGYRNYTPDYIKNVLNDYGYSLIEYLGSKNIIAQDNEGYKYKITLTNLQMGRVPSRWMKNPYATENVKLYMRVNYPNYIWIDDAEYGGCKTKHSFICKKHFAKGVQKNTFDNIMNNSHVCKYCGYEDLKSLKMISKSKAAKLCNEKNVEYLYRITKNHETYIYYECPFHKGKTQKMSLTHFKESKSPCKFCAASSGELKIQRYLESNNLEFIPQKTFKNCSMNKSLRFDFYLPEKKTAIEYDGQQHFFPVNFCGADDGGINAFELTKVRDSIKDKYCADNNIKLVRIPYWDYEKIEQILSHAI